MKEFLVALDRDHPGFRDVTYRQRRDAIAAVASTYREGIVPDVEYTTEEDGVWALISARLSPLHASRACRDFRDAKVGVAGRWPGARVPQFREVNAVLDATGFALVPAAGLMTPRVFLERLANGVFMATQYIRHASAPFYTPEPDIVHEVIGHAVLLTQPEFADLHRDIGRAAQRADEAQIQRLIRLYWYGLEFGLVREDGELRALGAGLLSSFGELERCATEPRLAPFEPDVVGATDFDPTRYQDTLFVAESRDELFRSLRAQL